MILQAVILSIMVVMPPLSAGVAMSADQKMEGASVQAQQSEQVQIYGSQLMTDQERIEYRTQMRNAHTEAEREQIRNEHHQLMKKRAAEQGVTLPEDPPAGRGGGMGSGKGAKGSNGGGKGRGAGRSY